MNKKTVLNIIFILTIILTVLACAFMVVPYIVGSYSLHLPVFTPQVAIYIYFAIGIILLNIMKSISKNSLSSADVKIRLLSLIGIAIAFVIVDFPKYYYYMIFVNFPIGGAEYLIIPIITFILFFSFCKNTLAKTKADCYSIQ